MRSSAALFLPLSLLVAIAACSSNTTIINHVGAGDSGVDDDAGVLEGDGGVSKDAGGKKDAGVITAQNPQPIPPVSYNGGALLLSPSLVTVTYDSDSLRTTVESFDDTIGTSAWWDAVRVGFCDASNKCIGQAKGGGHVHMPTASLQPSYTDSAGGGGSTLQAMITMNIMNGTFPAPTANTLYMIYFPSSATSISLDGDVSCQKFGGYHNSMKYNGTEFAYAIMPRCATGGGAQMDLDQLTNAASHELAEAATDPFIGTNPMNPYTGYGSFVDAWDAPAGGEVGDRCFDIIGSGNDQYKQGSWQVQRIFNNTAANAGHDPCVPAPSPAVEPYFNIAPMATDGDVINLKVGASASIQVQGISDAPISGQLAYDVVDLHKGNATIALSGGGGISIGQKATVTVSLKAGNPASGDSAVFLIRSSRTDGSGKSTGAIHYWPFVVQAQ